MDGNKNMTVHQAVWLAKLVEPYGLTWFEDPVINANPRLMAEVRHQTTIPIAAGSSGTTDMNALREFLLHNSVDYLQPNVRDIGGFTAGLKAAGMAQAFNIPISMGGNWPHMNMHLQAGVPHGGQVEFHWQGWQVGVMLFDGAPDPVNNTVTLSDRPGLGYTPKEGIVQEYAID
jgi:L-alanine-DL-glutamate epimerase-like enolase superfamily enzyme